MLQQKTKIYKISSWVAILTFLITSLLTFTITSGAVSTAATINVDAGTNMGTPTRLEQYNNVGGRGMTIESIKAFTNYKTKMLRAFVGMNEFYTDTNNPNSYNFEQWKTKRNADMQSMQKSSESLFICIKAPPVFLCYPAQQINGVWDGSLFKEHITRIMTDLKKNYSKINYICVWNEANVEGAFFPQHPLDPPEVRAFSDYWEVYKYFVKALESVNTTLKTNIKIGGPSSASFHGDIWIKPLIESCKKENIKLDFISWNYYSPNAKTDGHVEEAYGWLSANNMTATKIIPTEYGYLAGTKPNPLPLAYDMARQTARQMSAGFNYIKNPQISVKPMQWANIHSQDMIKSEYTFDYIKNVPSSTATYRDYVFDSPLTARYIKIVYFGHNNPQNPTDLASETYNDPIVASEMQAYTTTGIKKIPVNVFSNSVQNDSTLLFVPIKVLLDDVKGKTAPVWTSGGGGSRLLTLDMGSTQKSLGKLRIYWGNNNVEHLISIQSSTDNAVYTPVLSKTQGKLYPTTNGNLMKLQSMMANTRINANTPINSTGKLVEDPIDNGQELNSYATIDSDKVTLMMWNYQKESASTDSYMVNVDFNNLPLALINKSVIVDRYLISPKNSNYNYNKNSTLQKISTKTKTTTTSLKLTGMSMPANSVSLVVLRLAK